MILDRKELQDILQEIDVCDIQINPQMSLSRGQQYKVLTKLFEKVPIFSCREDLDKYLHREMKLGSGHYGTVYEERILTKPYCGWKVILKQSRYDYFDDLLGEITTLLRFNELVVNNVSPNFPYTYHYGKCKDYYYYIQEKQDKTLECTRVGDVGILTSLLVQGIMTVVVMQQQLFGMHSDFHTRNIMYKLGPSKVYNYILEGKQYIIDTKGYNLVVIDPGIFQSLNQCKYSSKYDVNIQNLVKKNALNLRTPNANRDIVTFLNDFLNMIIPTPANYRLMVVVEGWLKDCIDNPINDTRELIRRVEKTLYPILKIPQSPLIPLRMETYNIDRSQNLQLKEKINNAIDIVYSSFISIMNEGDIKFLRGLLIA